MWVIVKIDDEVFAVPISWVIDCNGQKKCWWPLQSERMKRSKNETPPPFGTHGWELLACVILLNGAIYHDFEDALSIEMYGFDIDDSSINERPKLSWNNEENEFERIITKNTKTINFIDRSETSVVNESLFSEFNEFQELIEKPDLCSTLNGQHIQESLCFESSTSKNYASKFIKSITTTEEVAQPANRIQSDREMLDTILKNQKEKHKISVKLMTRIYSLESSLGYNSN